MTKDSSDTVDGDDQPRSGSGAATSAGIEFQDDTATWLAVLIVAESAAPAPFGLGSNVTLESLVAESFNPVDDLRVSTSAGGQVFVQCKKRISLSEEATSEFASVIDQFVRQMIRGVVQSNGQSRGLNRDKDRLVLAVGPLTGAKITGDLSGALSAMEPAAGSDVAAEADESRNQKQAEALRVARVLFDAAWLAHTGAAPLAPEWDLFLKLTKVRQLDFRVDGPDWREIDILLRNHVLVDPTSVTAARNHLLSLVRGFGPNRTGGDRRYFRDELAKHPLALRGLRSMESDIAALRSLSDTRLTLLRELSEIRYLDAAIQIPRPVVAELTAMAAAGSLIVIGDPGSGKSGCIHDFAEQFVAEDRCILLDAQHLAGDSVVAIARGLGITGIHTLVDALNAWPLARGSVGSLAPCYLVIDALDQARGSASLSAISELLREVHARAPHWRVVVSMRVFDLRYSSSVQALFRGNPHPQLRSVSFPHVRHLEVPPLNAAEVTSARAQCPALASFDTREYDRMRSLLANPFNLRLLVELLSLHVPMEGFAAVRVRSDLLRLYWSQRVTLDDPSHGVENTAGALISEIKRCRDLGVNREALKAQGGFSVEGLASLLRRGVVRSDTRRTGLAEVETITFAHNILFDYAAARLWLRNFPPSVVQELESPAGEDLLLFARSSMSMVFEALWHESTPPTRDTRRPFWDAALALFGTRVRLTGKIIAASVAALEYRQLSDARYLCAHLDGENRDAARHLLKHFVNAAFSRFDPKGGDPKWSGDDAPDWMGLAVELTERAGGGLAWQARMLMVPIQRDKSAVLTADQAEAANRAARNLLAAELPRSPSGPAVATAIAMAARTIAVHPEETVRALLRVLHFSHSQHWHHLLHAMADRIATIATCRPELAAGVIHAAFSKDYTREDQLPPSSRVLPLVLNKHDSMASVRRTLAEGVGSMIVGTSPFSMRLAVAFIEAAVSTRHSRSMGRHEMHLFELRGQQVALQHDGSGTWSGMSYAQHDEWNIVLPRLMACLKDAASGQDRAALEAALDAVVKRARSGVLWNGILTLASEEPSTIGILLWELLRSKQILTDADTRDAAGGFLSAVWAHLDPQQRSLVETAIMALPDGAEPASQEFLSEERDALLGCVPVDELITPAATERAALLAASGGPPEHEKFSGSVSFGTMTPDEARLLRNPNSNNATATLARERADALERAKPATGDSFSASEVQSVLPMVQELLESFPTRRGMRGLAWRALTELRRVWASLVHGGSEGVRSTSDDAETLSFGEAVAYSKLARLADAPDLVRGTQAYCDVKRLLLAASRDPRPEPPKPGRDSNSSSWGSGQPRIEAAEGLMFLARNQKTPDNAVRKAIIRLSRDRYWAVRYQVRIHPHYLWEFDRELMWLVVEGCARDERDKRVLRFAAGTVQEALLAVDPDRVVRLLTTMHEHSSDDDDEDAVGSALVTALVRRVVFEEHAPSRECIASWIADPISHTDLLRHLVLGFRELSVFDGELPNGRSPGEVRRWVFGVLLSLTDRLIGLGVEVHSRNDPRPMSEWPKVDARALIVVVRLTDLIAGETYFASGALDESFDGSDAHKQADAHKAEQAARFFGESRDLLDRLCDVPYINAAHDVLKTLQFLIPMDPKRAFALICRCVSAAKKDAIDHEWMAADLVAELVRKYLVEYRGLFRGDRALQTRLMEMLDLFVEAGWPEATRLMYQLDDALR